MGRELHRVPMNFPMDPSDDQINYRLRREAKGKTGPGYQMWQTVSDRPYTPVFATAEELAQFCAANPWGAERDHPIPYETWLAFINGPGFAPSMVATAGQVTTGVEWATTPPPALPA